ncbi:MAG: PAS domain S-box protein [Desulfobaccales bacterium]
MQKTRSFSDTASDSAQHQQEVEALLAGSQAVLSHPSFEDAAKAIFETCKTVIGATAGFVALLGADNTETELLFLDAGGVPCSVDPGRSMPIRGFLNEAFRLGQPMFDNDFDRGDRLQFLPLGHMRLANVLFAPLIVGGRAAGLLGLANKPDGFTGHDAYLAERFADFAAIALRHKRAEETLKESEARFRQLFESAADALWLHDRGTIIEVNQQACQNLGHTRAELLQLNVSDIEVGLGPEELTKLWERDTPHLTTFVGRRRRKDGSTYPVEVRTTKFFFGGRHLRLAAARDITDRQRVEDALKAAKGKLEYLLTASPAVIYSCEITPPHRATFFSENVVSLLGYDRRELMDNPALWQESIHPEDVPGVSAATAILFECGHISMEYRFRRKDGDNIWIQDELILGRDDHDNPREIVGFLINISKRKRAEAALRQSEIQYRSLVENTLDGYIIYKFPAGKFLFLNQRMCQLYGCSRKEGLRLSFRDLIVEPEQDRFHHWVQAHVEGENQTAFPQIFSLRGRDGATLLAEVAVSLISYQENPAVQVVIRDISERERLRQQVQYAQKMQALGTMAAGIAHEIRSPLTVCSSAAQFILDDDLTPEFKRQCLEKMLAGITKASTIIENLLKFARSPERVEATRMELGTVVNDTLALVTNQARLQNVFMQKVIPVAPIYFQGFAGLLPQAFMNLFLNAVNAMPDGGTLSVRLEPSEHEAMVVITDTGHGIAASDLPYIFDPFFSNSQVGQGTGLGLSICQSIIKQHLGSIEVESNPGQGTCFIVRLPRLQPVNAPAGPSQ